MARLDEKLNLIIPVERPAGTAYVHSTPISREVFEANFRLLTATYRDLFEGESFGNAAPRVATLTMREIGRRQAKAKGDEGDGGADALLAEIKRLTVVGAPTENGWQLVPVDAAISRGSLDIEEWREVESGIVFFMCSYVLAPHRMALEMGKALASAMGLSTTSSPPSEWMNSLPSSTPGAISPQPQPTAGVTPLSSIPS